MRYGLFSDVHGNFPALESVIHAFQNENIDQYFCAGDVVGYGADPVRCIDRVKNLPSVCVAGNHDWAVLGKVDTSDFNPAAKAAIVWTKKNISSEDSNFLKGLTLIHKNADFILVHGSLQEPERFHYLFDREETRGTFDLMDRAVCFVGHTHVAGVFVEENHRVSDFSFSNLKVEKNRRYIVNLGSVGQPRDGDSRAYYCIFDTKTKMISIKRVDYDVTETQRRILNAGLPEFLASRLILGQ